MGDQSLPYKVPFVAWFAWYPVTVNGQQVWLKTVYRRPARMFPGQYDYCTIFDIIKQ